MANHRQKRTYATRAEAIGGALSGSRKTGAALRVYPCSDCKGFHLTKEKRGGGRRVRS